MGGQANVKIVDNDGSDAGIIIGNSGGGGIEVLTIATNVAAGADQECRSVILWTNAADTKFTIGSDAAVTGDFLLLANQYLPVPVNNTALLQFFGTDGKKVYLLWRD